MQCTATIPVDLLIYTVFSSDRCVWQWAVGPTSCRLDPCSVSHGQQTGSSCRRWYAGKTRGLVCGYGIKDYFDWPEGMWRVCLVLSFGAGSGLGQYSLYCSRWCLKWICRSHVWSWSKCLWDELLVHVLMTCNITWNSWFTSSA